MDQHFMQIESKRKLKYTTVQKAEVATLISNKIDVKTKTIIKDKDRH